MKNEQKIDDLIRLKDDQFQHRRQVGLKFRWSRERKNLSQSHLADICGTTQQTVNKFENGLLKNPTFLDKSYEALGITKEWLFGAQSYAALIHNEIESRKFIEEIGVNGESSGPAWSIPPAALGLSPQSLTGLEIRQVIGDAMAPDFRAGDYVVINTADILPSPAGIFMIHDGHGLQIRRIEPIPGKKLRISTSNPSYAPYEDEAELVKIYGRIVLKISRV